MSTHLQSILEETRPLLLEALRKDKAELASLEERVRHLREEISRAEGVLGERSDGVDGTELENGLTLTLHDALAEVLADGGNSPMSAHELADAVNGRGLYRRRKDGRPIDASQVHARTKKYGELFEKHGAQIRLHEEAPVLVLHDKTVKVFREDDAGFFDWLDQHQDGYFINTTRTPKPSYLVLHRSECPHIDRSPSVRWTHEYVKVCSDKRAVLDTWASERVGGETTLCQSCFG
jgi:hypothetical protein